jgi:hypothetical protein
MWWAGRRRELPALNLTKGDLVTQGYYDPTCPPVAEITPADEPFPHLPLPDEKTLKEAASKPRRKIAVLGSAVSSVGTAPFHLPEWEIWGCSPANRNLPRCEVWFELHNLEVKKREGLTEWIQWLATQPNVFVQKPTPDLPNGRTFPLKQLVEKYGPYWWTNQVSYMLALAIEQKPETIGLYGVDMAASSEYNQQRPSVQFFLQEARALGIEVIVPPESDILEPPPMYGYCESSRRWRKMYAREIELKGRIADLASKESNAAHEKAHLMGALDDLQYQQGIWANTMDFE